MAVLCIFSFYLTSMDTVVLIALFGRNDNTFFAQKYVW